MKKIAILGITGSIGKSVCEVIRAHQDEFQIVLASSHTNWQDAMKLVQEFSIPNLVITDSSANALPKTKPIYQGAENLTSLLQSIDCDIVINAISGSAGLPYSILALKRGLQLALANKESLVMAGKLMMQLSQQHNAAILPIDSEHSAIMQAIGATPRKEIKKIILTASGGPFRTLPTADFAAITLEDSLQHPTWSMGAKITIDSATMLNKGLEIIEAQWLFQLDISRISAVIHPQSIIHSLVEFVDGSLLAQLSTPTMKLPILYALSYPHRLPSNLCETDLLSLPPITFEAIPPEKYPLFYTALAAAKEGGIFPTILNAANEAAISLFFRKKIAFCDIANIVEKTLQTEENIANPDLETILQTNKAIYQKVLTTFM